MTTGITFNLATRRLIFGVRPCSWCGDRTGTKAESIPVGRDVKYADKPCDKCKGTGRRGRGKCQNCRVFGYGRPIGMVADYDAPYDAGPCGNCKGTGEQLATRTDTVPADTLATMLAVIPIQVVRGAPPQHSPYWSDLWSSTDYGAAWKRIGADPDGLQAKLAEQIAGDRVQACKLADDTGLVCDHITVFVQPNGYTVKAMPADGVVVEAPPEPTNPISVMLRQKMERETLRYAVSRQIQCPLSSVILDMRRAVMVTATKANGISGSEVFDAKAYDTIAETLATNAAAQSVTLEILDGRVLWPKRATKASK